VWAPGAVSPPESLGGQVWRKLPKPETLHARPTFTSGGRHRGWDALSTSTPLLRRFGHQVRPTLHSIDSRNLLAQRPPQCQEHSKIDKKAVEASTDPDELTSSTWGLSGHITFLDVNVIGHGYPAASRRIKSPLPLRQGTQEHFPLPLSKLLEPSAHPHCNHWSSLISKMLDVGLLPDRRGLNHDEL
jgi:hypothetical protein